jgi:hypothetical protein
MRRQPMTYLMLCLGLLALGGCTGPTFKVAPLPKAPPADAATGAAGNLEVSAAALTDDERALEQFDANLRLAGVSAVEVQLRNRAAEAFQAAALRFELRDAAGTTYRRLEPKKALQQLMKYYGKSVYLKESHRQTQERFDGLALAATALAPQEERRGFLFFEAKRKEDAAKLSGLTLHISGGAAPITLQLN